MKVNYLPIGVHGEFVELWPEWYIDRLGFVESAEEHPGRALESEISVSVSVEVELAIGLPRPGSLGADQGRLAGACHMALRHVSPGLQRQRSRPHELLLQALAADWTL